MGCRSMSGKNPRYLQHVCVQLAAGPIGNRPQDGIPPHNWRGRGK